MTDPSGTNETALTRLIHPERAKMIPVTGTNDQPDLPNAVDVQFNPTSLKVTLSNTLNENERDGGSRSAQFVDKSSSTLTVELIFDTTHIDEATQRLYQNRVSQQGRTLEAIAVGSDVRLLTKRIAEQFVQPTGSGDELTAPNRCLFQWGAFEFIGMVETYEETLDFFSPEGRPLRATLSLKLTEDRFQFRQGEVEQAERETPSLTSTGNTDNTGGGTPPGTTPPGSNQDTKPLTGGTSKQQRDWRKTALYNGVESPRLPKAPVLAVPPVSAGAALKLTGGGGLNGSFGVSANITAGLSGGSISASATASSPAFRFGASKSLGTGIAGAFDLTGKANLSASLSSGVSAELSVSGQVTGAAKNKTTIKITPDDGVGFD